MSVLPLIFIQFLNVFCTKAPDCHQQPKVSKVAKIRTAGTGTVLFNPTDIDKQCWSQDELAILTARMVLEDVVPDPRTLSLKCNNDVEDLIEYFKTVIETVRSLSTGRKKHIMLLAVTDLLGGYMHHAVLPLAKRGFYAGIIDYVFIEKLIQFYEEVKWFLKTNGQGWSKAVTPKKPVDVPVIQFDVELPKKLGNDSYCSKLLYYEYEPLKSSAKRSVSGEKGIYFPLPFFDAKYRPTAIVVPFKRFALRNIESKRSAYLLMKYYLVASKCLAEKNAKPSMVEKFQNNLYAWIDTEALPKLRDDKFYSAFGGLLRVEATLKAMGAKVGEIKSCDVDKGEEEVGAVPTVGESSKRTTMVLAAILIVIMAWFIIGSCFVCLRMKGNGRKKPDKEEKAKRSDSASTLSSSRWSSIWSKTSAKSKSTEATCKCCASVSEKSTVGYTSSSEFDNGKTKKKGKYKSSSRPPKRDKRTSQSSPCVCPPDDGPAIIETRHSMKVLPSIAEMSEHSTLDKKRGGFRKITFARRDSEDATTTDDERVKNKRCAAPWDQTERTVQCPNRTLDKSTTASSSGPPLKQANYDSVGRRNDLEPSSGTRKTSDNAAKENDTTTSDSRSHINERNMSDDEIDLKTSTSKS
ncbi:uncharacterized protein LOC132706676 isoform X2 [Cylas formicarius]|uniref:uncharacterized protein LOC132706676 isoform X2 n=1 Tax=Cylas formicarius TaxID=197179 RepID=UPI0029584492|nr:uncharacterized protein LOC132706676 isoform X2 [Cylas formicarius]